MPRALLISADKVGMGFPQLVKGMLTRQLHHVVFDPEQVPRHVPVDEVGVTHEVT